MNIREGGIYHIFNQGNNQDNLFQVRENYILFLDKVRKYIHPQSDMLAYCLMPNHFHFLVYANAESVKEEKIGPIKQTSLANGFRLLLSSYTQALNKQRKQSGSLFKQRTRAILLSDKDKDYPSICFEYIHQNPMRANMVDNLEDWEYSSFLDYEGQRNGSLCNLKLADQILDFSREGSLDDVDSYRLEVLHALT